MNTCDTCHHETNNRKRSARGDLECSPCRVAREYYDGLSPEELRAEHEAIARYVEESENW